MSDYNFLIFNVFFRKKQHNSSANKQRKKDTPRKAGSDSSENKKKEDVCWYHEKFGDRCRPDKCRPPFVIIKKVRQVSVTAKCSYNLED